MKFKFKCKQEGLFFKEGDFVTLGKVVEGKRQYFVAKDYLEKNVLVIENSKEDGFNTIKELTKFLKSKDNDYVEKDLCLIKFTVTNVEDDDVIIEGEFNELCRSIKFKTSNKVGKFISNVSVKDLFSGDLVDSLFDSKLLMNLVKMVEMGRTSPELVKGYVSSHDGKEVTFRLESVEETLNYHKKLDDAYNKKLKQLTEDGIRHKTLILESLPNLCNNRHLLNSGDVLVLDDELKDYLELTSEEISNNNIVVKVVTDTNYLGKKHYLVTF